MVTCDIGNPFHVTPSIPKETIYSVGGESDPPTSDVRELPRGRPRVIDHSNFVGHEDRSSPSGQARYHPFTDRCSVRSRNMVSAASIGAPRHDKFGVNVPHSYSKLQELVPHPVGDNTQPLRRCQGIREPTLRLPDTWRICLESNPQRVALIEVGLGVRQRDPIALTDLHYCFGRVIRDIQS
jgi:hypothetical protein